MMSFGEWLQTQQKSDPDRLMPYAPLYEVVEDLRGQFGDSFDLTMIMTWLRETYPGSEEIRYSEALVIAEANWRLDSLVMDHPEDMVKAVESVPEPKAPAIEIDVKSAPGVPEVGRLPCGFRGVDGNECSSPAVLGGARCTRHGGMILDPDVRRSLLITAYARLISNTDLAVETLVDVMVDGRNEIARVSASKELLDRAGMTPEQHITFNDTTTLESDDEKSARAIDVMRSRLDATRDRLRLVSIPAESKELPPTGSD